LTVKHPFKLYKLTNFEEFLKKYPFLCIGDIAKDNNGKTKDLVEETLINVKGKEDEKEEEKEEGKDSNETKEKFLEKRFRNFKKAELEVLYAQSQFPFEIIPGKLYIVINPLFQILINASQVRYKHTITVS